MHNLTTLLRITALLLWLTNCSDEGRDIRDYYFPIQSLLEGQVYAYQAEMGDTSEWRYWYYRTFVRDSGTFFSGVQYDRFFQINLIVREKIEPTGAVARQVLLYEPDTTAQRLLPVEATIESDDLFPFRVRDSLGVFLYSLKYRPPADTTAEIYLIRNRRYLGPGPDFYFEGKTYPTVRFALREAVGHQAEGAAELEGSGEEWYAKGLGLVYFRKTFGREGQIQLAFRLRERFSMSELERRALQLYGEDEEEHEH